MAYKKDISDEEVEKELEKALKEEEERSEHKCGVPLSESKEVGVQRSDVKVKND